MKTMTYWRFCALLLMVAVSTARAGGETRSVEAEAVIPASPAAVLRAFLDDSDLKGWWQVTRSLVQPEPGGVWSIAWDDWGEEKTHHSWSGVIEVLDDNRLVISNMVMIEPGMPLLGPMRLEITVAAEGTGTRLRVSHGGYGYGEHWEEMYNLVVQGWNHVLVDLESWGRTNIMR